MRIIELRLNNFGKFHNKIIKLEDGINLVYGDNEAGKSTMHSFIRGMLFGIEKLRGRASKDDIYLKYQPWDTPGVYNGSMDIEVSGKKYRILRNFDKNTKGLNIIDLETGREQNIRPEEITDLYEGLTEAGYRNTISIEQLKSRTDQELVEEVRNYITNLSLSKSNEVDVSRALSFLQEKKKDIESLQTDAKLEALEAELAEDLDYEARIRRLTLQLEESAAQEDTLRNKLRMEGSGFEIPEGFPSIEEYKAYLEQYPVIKEKYRSYCESLNLRNTLCSKQALLSNSLQEIDKKQEDYLHISSLLTQLATLKSSLAAVESKKEQLSAGKETGNQSIRLKQIIASFIPLAAAALGVLSFVGKNYLFAGLCLAITLAGIAVMFMISHHDHGRQRTFDQEYKAYEKQILIKQSDIREILLQSHVSDEQELRKRQEELLRSKLSEEHMKAQNKDFQEQISQMDKKVSVIEEEIQDYIERFPESLQIHRFGNSELDPSIIGDFEEFIMQQKQQITKYQEEAAKEYEACRLQMEKIKWEISELEDRRITAEEKLLENKEQQKELIRQRQDNEQELSALKLAAETINSLSAEIHDSFGGKLNRLVSDLAGEVTKGRYTDIKVDEKLNIKVEHKDNFISIDKLSAGTIEQLYLSMRIAIANLVYGERSMPILLDDCLVLYDDNRTKAVLESLTKENKGQVILFTCHKREKIILDQLQVKYQYIDLSEE